VLPGGPPAFYICFMKHELGCLIRSEGLAAFYIYEYEAHLGSQNKFRKLVPSVVMNVDSGHIFPVVGEASVYVSFGP